MRPANRPPTRPRPTGGIWLSVVCAAISVAGFAGAGCGDSEHRSDAERPPARSKEVLPNGPANPVEPSSEGPPTYDPLAYARETIGQIGNREATIPPQCYTKTEGRANPCWTCHTRSHFPNAMSDWDLQAEYSFSETALDNPWTNLFVDRRAEIDEISDQAVITWIRGDNYGPLREALAALPPRAYRGYRPDLDFDAGFDDEGFARDGSDWRAFRYKPFPGEFWPTNGSADDVAIRLPARFRERSTGELSISIYKVNLAILEASFGADPLLADAALRWPTEALDERAAGIDLDGDGELEGEVHELVGLPQHYVGGAGTQRVRRRVYPRGVEFLHSVRYLDPGEVLDPGQSGEAPALGPSTRMKELRYSRKQRELSDEQILNAYAHEAEEKREGGLPEFRGSPLEGMRNDFGWTLQAFIEDAQGRLRLQSEEEHYSCMGCHSNLGVTADQTFALPRKLPGAAGWGYQSLAGMPDAPQVSHRRGEVPTYLERAAAGDEFRANEEMIARWFEDGRVDGEALAQAPDLAALITPSRARALALDKAYWLLVREQSFALGRVAVLAPLTHVHTRIEASSTGLSEAGRIEVGGVLQLDWPAISRTPR